MGFDVQENEWFHITPLEYLYIQYLKKKKIVSKWENDLDIV